MPKHSSIYHLEIIYTSNTLSTDTIAPSTMDDGDVKVANPVVFSKNLSKPCDKIMKPSSHGATLLATTVVPNCVINMGVTDYHHP